MHALLLPLLAAVPLALPADAGTLLTYRGQIVAERDERETSRKEITYRVLVNGEGEKGTDLLWMVSENGHGSASWIDQFGRLEVDARGRAAAGEPAAVLYEHAEG